LTPSIQYSLAQAGVLQNTPEPFNQNITSFNNATMFLGKSVAGDAKTAFGAGLRNNLETGILSVTGWFNEGESGSLHLSLLSSSDRHVPIPDMLLPTLIGIIGVVIHARRQTVVDGIQGGRSCENGL
jgi:hypothetical protein